MFEAGALSRGQDGRTRWIWPSVAATLAIALAGESVFLAARPATRVVERVVIREPSRPDAVEPTTTTPTPSPESLVLPGRVEDPARVVLASSWDPVSDYQRRQGLVLRFGLDAFPEEIRLSSQSVGPPDASDDGPTSAGALRRIELEKLNKPGGHS